MSETLSEADLQEVNTLISRINGIPAKIRAIHDQGRKISSDPNQLFLFKGMFREIRNYFQTFNDTWDQIMGFYHSRGITDEFPSEQQKSWPMAVQSYYYEACAIYEQYMNPTPNPASRSDNSTLNESRTVRARLPQINLPHFGSNPREWPLFRDTYLSLIHNEPTLSDMEKFLFLVSCLNGPARSLISTVSLTESNYQQAWKVLKEHYDDKRKLAYNYLSQVLDFKPLSGRPTAATLKKLITSVIECIDSFNHLNVPDVGDFILSFLVLRCLDPVTKQSFERKYTEVDFPTYKNLVDFIKVEWKSLDAVYTGTETSSFADFSSNQGPSSSSFRYNSKKTFFTGNSSSRKTFSSQSETSRKPQPEKLHCPVCNSVHSLYQCDRFRKASAPEKLALIQNWPGCRNCLSGKHSSQACTSIRRCTHCNQAHHSWLHQPQGLAPLEQQNDQTPEGVTLGSISGEGEVVLGTAIIQIKDSHGVFRTIRIVTDSGSQFSFLTSECARKLGYTIQPGRQKITGIGEVQLANTLGKLSCTFRSCIPSFSSTELNTEAVIVTKITNDLPQSPLPATIQQHYKGYALADPDFCKSGPIDALIGVDLFFDIITGPPVTITPSVPKLVPSIFGFIIAGPIKSRPISSEGSSLFVQSREDLKDIMTKFWEVEEVKPVSKPSEEDEFCEKHFKETHYRLDSGRYVVSLPVKPSIATLENPHNQAFKRLMNIEAKLAKDINLKSEYHLFMREYLELGHMTQCTPGSAAYTLPHHAVIKRQDGDLKLRTVFDASCRTSTGSLNDHLLIGPKLQLDIRDILTNFRIHKVVLTADIVKMYRQILLHPPDRKYQHILWRFDPADAVQEYELCTVTYGEGSAPFQAQRTVKQLVQDEGERYPLASRALLEDMYVDDVVTGAESLEEAKELQVQLVNLLEKGCFKLSKWASNCKELLEAVSVNERQIKAISLSSEEEPRIKILGMQWIPSRDIFTYEITAPPWHPTKRAILSAIARMYDPLGFLSPVIFLAKTILQDMWVSKCGWDEPGPPQICQKWHQFLTELSSLSEVKIPRHICASNLSPILVGFCDASQRGYSAVLYLLTMINSQPNVHILKAKNKLAPTKPMTIPRLELSGALLLANLYKSCEKLILKLEISESRFFTDSEVVLGWLSTPPQKLNAFVAHRVVEILEVTKREQWTHVKSADNPADCSSRGLFPSQLPENPLWWAGPHWLRLPEDQWPSHVSIKEDLPEIKKNHSALLSAVKSEPPIIITWMERFSSYLKLLRAKIEQKHLRSLNAFYDEVGLLRVGGRLQNSALCYDAKHPIIISGKSRLAKLIADHYHRANLHLGPTSLQAMLHSKYWIVNARNLIRRCVFECTTCYKANHVPKPPLMGNLPPYRIQDGQVFHHVGVDFGGPFLIKESLRRKAAPGKAYLCLFICMATKAVHLELVSKCSTEAFLATLDRFVARRGKPTYMYSDCGTNFIGAANKLRDLMLLFKSSTTQDHIMQVARDHEIQWSFNPPSAPHFGGIWEAGIKAAKAILNKVVGETPLTFEELSTLFCNIEAILNSRPLTPVDANHEGLEYLTPGHFLIGRPITSVLEENLVDTNVSLLKRWDMIKQRSQHFWKRWRNEYLNQLQQRKKWTNPTENVKVGDLVIIKDSAYLQRSWPMARIVETHAGQDGVVRVVTIKTSSGVYKRPLSPNFWGRINPEWSLCHKGRRQSPVNLEPAKLLFDPNLRVLDMDKLRVSGTLVNTGHSVLFKVHNSTKFHVNFTGGPLSYRYLFDHIVVHYGLTDGVGSEHTINGIPFPAELQIYGYNVQLYSNYSEAVQRAQGIAAISVLLQLGDLSNPELRILTDNLDKIRHGREEVEVKRLSIHGLLPDTEFYMTYDGSTTAPPCHETLVWLILNKPIYITKQQLHALRRLMQGEGMDPNSPLGNNYRPPQPLHHRPIRTNIDFSGKQGGAKQCPSMYKEVYYKANTWKLH